MSVVKEVSEQEAMDAILKYLIENKSHKPIHSHTIWKNLYPEQDEEVVYFILRKIMNTVDNIVTTNIRSDELHNFDVFFEANGITKKYLFDQGGFTKLYEDRQREKIEQDRIELLNKQKLETEIDIIKFQKGLGKKLTIWGFIVAVISVLTSVLLSVYTSNSNQSENSKIDSLNIKIKTIEKELLEFKKVKKIKQKTTANNGSYVKHHKVINNFE